MSDQKVIRFGVVGCGLMGREFASAAARWCHLDAGDPLPFRPEIAAVCDLSAPARDWFTRNLPSVKTSTDDYRALLDDPSIDALYVAVPHNLHADVYADVIASGKAMLGEKPFGIDAAANAKINAALADNPKSFVRCSSEIPFFPGAQRVVKMERDGAFGRILDVEAGFWHSSDLNPDKAINWKRRIATCGEYGCLGDLGMHPLHLPLRFGWKPADVRAVLSKIVETRPDGKGNRVPCETWDNGTLLCRVKTGDQDFPMTVSTKRIAPGNNNTWFIRVSGTENSAEFTTANPKVVRTLPYTVGGEQAWRTEDVPFAPPYATITGGIFEFGFPDAMQQMWAAFCDEMTNGRDGMRQPFYCATPGEAASHHAVLTAALASQAGSAVVTPEYGGATRTEVA